ncbi:MAG: MerR family transcriptional regulator [Lachnospiraceae bacterium]|nr:MerR family transcriptional regulator [Lachnospiraceae bacterium]
MMTVKEVSGITGISVRTLHYYDEIGLFSPTEKSEAGYRLYDDKALEKLRQILFFREFDIPLKQIKAVMDNPALDRNEILQMQRRMLVRKKERMERLIASIDEILKGDNKMDFEVFSKSEIEEIWDSLYENCNDAQRALFIAHYGSEEEWRKHFLENAASEEAQKNFAKIVEWYGSKEKAMEAQKNPTDAGLITAYQKRITAIMQKLADKMGTDVNAFEIREIVGEYDFVAKQLYQMDDVTALMLELAARYQTNEMIQKVQDSIYGDGATAYIGQAIQAFYV